LGSPEKNGKGWWLVLRIKVYTYSEKKFSDGLRGLENTDVGGHFWAINIFCGYGPQSTED